MSMGWAVGVHSRQGQTSLSCPPRLDVYHRIQNGSGAHPASYPMGTRGSFPGGKAAGA